MDFISLKCPDDEICIVLYKIVMVRIVYGNAKTKSRIEIYTDHSENPAMHYNTREEVERLFKEIMGVLYRYHPKIEIRD
jgi:hypothetical protein